jgi:hypothetical protein
MKLGWDNNIISWDLRKMEKVNSWSSTLGSEFENVDSKIMCLQIDARRIIVGNDLGQLRVWNISDNSFLNDICKQYVII